MTEFIERIMALSENARTALAQDSRIGHYVDLSLPIPRPFSGTGAIKLIVIGQDPTVQEIARRKTVKTVLTLDEPHSQLRKFIDQLCIFLDLDLEKNVYGTNLCKNFYRDPPNNILDVNILSESMNYWLPVLLQELNKFPDAVIVTLGRPVLRTLVRNGERAEVNEYWGYHRKWREGKFNNMCNAPSEMNLLNRDFFPYIHHRAKNIKFYAHQNAQYAAFIKASIG